MIIDKIPKAKAHVGSAIKTPYFAKSLKDSLTLWSLSKPVNIMPAKAPIGVKKAPIFDPIMDAYIAR